MSADQQNPKQRLWHDILDDQRAYPEAPLDLPAWERFIERGVTAYDGDSKCIWRDGTDVFLDTDVPYVKAPHPDFPHVYAEDTQVLDPTPVYCAWEPSGQTPSPQSHEERLDEIVSLTTASSSMQALVESVRGTNGYGQKYTPTLRPEHYAEIGRPDIASGLHEVRAELQNLGFKVFPDDEYYEQRAPELDDANVYRSQQGGGRDR